MDNFETAVIGFVGRGSARIMAVRVECDPNTTLLRPVKPEYEAAAKKLYDAFIDRALNSRVTQPKVILEETVRLVAETASTVTIIRRGSGCKLQLSPSQRSMRKGALLKHKDFYKSKWDPDNCWKTHRKTQYRHIAV